jgi:hypothetical protein
MSFPSGTTAVGPAQNLPYWIIQEDGNRIEF